MRASEMEWASRVETHPRGPVEPRHPTKSIGTQMTILNRDCQCSKADMTTWSELFPEEDAGPAWTWGAEADESRWELGPEPEGDSDHLWNAGESAYEPTPAERAEAAEMFARMDAERLLNTGDHMTLEGLVRHSAGFYRNWSTQAGELIADTLDALADRIAFVKASTPAELAAREEILDDDLDAIDTYRANSR